jgi:hypothetical protein
MNRRSFFRLGVGAALSPIAAKVIPACMVAEPVQKMEGTRHYRQYLLPDDAIEYGCGIDPTLVELQKELSYRLAMSINLAVQGLT